MAIFDEHAGVLLSSLAGVLFCLVEVGPDRNDCRAKRTHASDLQWVGIGRDENLDADAATAAGISNGLSEVAGRGTDDRLLAIESVEQEVSAAALEAANWVCRFDLYDRALPETCRELVVSELRT